MASHQRDVIRFFNDVPRVVKLEHDDWISPKMTRLDNLWQFRLKLDSSRFKHWFVLKTDSDFKTELDLNFSFSNLFLVGRGGAWFGQIQGKAE